MHACIGRATVALQPKGFQYAGHKMIMFEKDFAPKNVYWGVPLRVIAKKIGEHEIPIHVTARGVYEYKEKLVLKVVK